jgi:hypothetical protein
MYGYMATAYGSPILVRTSPHGVLTGATTKDAPASCMARAVDSAERSRQ